ncbi:MAG: type III-A CRISPR-associated RAMP protein Csm5 [Comamonadaceae bacterium]|nr:type III-A CRISPR-associated RAMP protein Csm5 [Comamonadaceae bacterium]
MNTFLKTYRLALTPLSPIHIGCGEDFEPTNYVIDEGVLYGFDPSRAVLNDLQKSKLTDAANKASLLAIQRFFRDNAQVFKAQADVLMPVSEGVAQAYERNVGRAANIEASGNMVFNRLYIERTMHTGQLRQPYIPGSSFKGAVRTTILDELNRSMRPMENCSKTSSKMEERLLKGDFATSPLRLLKVADLMPASDQEPARRVMFAVNRKKKQIIKDGQELQPKGIAARKECILHGQYRAFVSDAVLPSLDPHHDSKTTPVSDLRPTDMRVIARQSNVYNQTRLQRELAILDGRGLVNPVWKQGLEALLSGAVGKKLSSGDAFLIRLGRYGGADSKTLSGEGVACIKIMGAKGQPPSFESTTKTVWLAAENENDQKHLLPFGWAVVEIDPVGDLPQLKAWCDAQSKGRPDMVKLRQRFEADKALALKLKNEMTAQAAAREAARQAEQAAAEQRAQAMEAMTEQGKQIETLRQQCEDLDAKITGGNFRKQAYSAGSPGPLYQEAARLVKQATENTDWTAVDKKALADMLEQWLPKVVAPFGKDERKKLKLTALRGQS